MTAVKETQPQDVHTHLDHYRVIDVRQPHEWNGELGCIAQAELISLGDVPQEAGQWDQDQPLLIVCRSGQRSDRAAQFLIANGFQDVTNLVGGMIAWNTAGFIAEPRSK
jgi:rhodanese-related sulfurtransferase